MRIFSPDVRLPSSPFGGTHSPVGPRRYQSFRSCLRWDFGFICAACLLHDRQLGPDGYGQTTAEHYEPRSLRPDLTHDYKNLLYLCRRCNVARRDRPSIDARGRRLLDPRTDPWAAHFDVTTDEIHAKPGDPHADYTEEAYDLNDEVKVAIRRRWRLRLERWLAEAAVPTSSRAFLLAEIALAFNPIPDDPPAQCLCRPVVQQVLPKAVVDVQLDLPP